MPEMGEVYASVGTPPPHHTVTFDPHVMVSIQCIGLALVIVLCVLAHSVGGKKR